MYCEYRGLKYKIKKKNDKYIIISRVKKEVSMTKCDCNARTGIKLTLGSNLKNCGIFLKNK